MSFCFVNPPRIAVVGCSWFARAAHLPALRQLEAEGLVEIVALCSRSNESLAIGQQLVGRDVKTYTNFEELLAQTEIDVVDLVLPTTLMNAAIQMSLQAGKHVISEKPCAASVSQCRELLATYSRHDGGLFWAVAENWPFKPTIQLIKNTIQKCNLGELQSIDFKYIVPGIRGIGWRSSPEFRGGYVLDSGVHFVSMLRYLTGGILEVNADVGWRGPSFVADRVDADISFENNVNGKFIVSFAEDHYSGDRYQLVIKCRGATIRADLLNSQLILQVGESVQNIDIPNDPWVQGGVYPMLRHCCESLSNGTAASCSPMEGLKDVAAIEAMIESSRLGKPVMPAVLYNQLNGSGPPLRTFAGVQDFKPLHLVEASSILDIKAAIKEASSRGLKVRSLGSGNSWSEYVKTKDVSIRLAGLNNITNLNLEKKTISAGAGARLGDLTRKLAEHNLCLPSLPFFPNATLGGTIATGMHGTSPHWGTVSDLVQSMTLVTSLGEVIKIDSQTRGNLLNAARVSVGMLGVIAEAELQAIPMRWVRNIRIETTVEEFINLQQALFARYEHVWIHWILGEDRFVVQCLETRSEPEDGFSPYVAQDVGNWVMTYEGPQAAPTANTIMLSMQYGIPLAKLPQAIKNLNESKFASEYRLNEIEIKFLKKTDGGYLGPNSDYDAALFNIWWPVDRYSVNDVFADFEGTMRGLNARPHWGKYHTPPSVAYMEETYPNWAQFDSVRRELDPKGMFSIFDD